jgi:hypothetical protein
LFKLFKKVLNSEASGFGCNQILLESLDKFLSLSKNSLFILKSLDFHSKFHLNFTSPQNTFHLKVHFDKLIALIFTFIHWYHHPGSSLFHIGSQISDQFSNFHGQYFSISSINCSAVKSSAPSVSAQVQSPDHSHSEESSHHQFSF